MYFLLHACALHRYVLIVIYTVLFVKYFFCFFFVVSTKLVVHNKENEWVTRIRNEEPGAQQRGDCSGQYRA